MVAGTQAVIDAGGGVIVGLGHAALFHNRVGQWDGRQQAPGVGVDGMLKDLLGGAGLQQVARWGTPMRSEIYLTMERSWAMKR